MGLEFGLEPINQVHERIMIILVEVVASGLDLDVLFDQLIFRQVAEDHVLRVLVENTELVRDP